MWVWQCQHAISRASSVGVNSHPAFDEKPGIKFVWPNFNFKPQIFGSKSREEYI